MKARCIASFAALLLGAVSVFCFTSPAGAQVNYQWDPGQTKTGSDGSSNWDSGTNWANASSDLAWSDGNNALFGYGGTAGTVTIGNMVAPNSITFNAAGSGNYLVTGGSINLPNTTAMVITATNAGATISSAMVGAGSGGLTTYGNLTLNGNLSFTGGLTVNNGTVTLTGSNSFGGFYNSDPGQGAGNHTNGNPTVVNAGGVLSFSSSANLPQVNPNWLWQDTNLLQLNGGTLLDTGTGTISTYSRHRSATTPRSTSRMPAPTSFLTGALARRHLLQNGVRCVDSRQVLPGQCLRLRAAGHARAWQSQATRPSRESTASAPAPRCN